MIERLIVSLVVSIGGFVYICEIFYRMYIRGFSYKYFNKISINISKFCDFQFEILILQHKLF